MLVVFDVGGTGCRVAGSKDGRSVADVVKISTPPRYSRGLKELVRLIKEAAAGQTLTAVAGGIAGVWDKNRTTLLKSPNLPDWESRTVRKKLEIALGVPVILENDAALEALGEAKMGAGRKAGIMAYVCIGTGIGGARIVDGKIDERLWGFEPGQQIIFHEGQVGYWERLASGKAMEKFYKVEPKKLTDPQAWEKEIQVLAIGIHNVIVMWSPEVVVLGGSVIESVDLSRLKIILKQQMKIFPEIPKIVKGELGDKAGLFGALELLRNHHHTPEV